MKRTAQVCVMVLLGVSTSAFAQTCTPQASMQSPMRMVLADTALMLASAVKSGDTSAVKASTVDAYANHFAPVEHLIQTTSDKLQGDTLRVTQVYLLDTSGEKSGESNELDVTCPLEGTTAETDFSIPGVAPGIYGFAMVEATGGEHPWLLSFLLQKEESTWKMAGLYPHARTAAGKDGIWYWKDARAKVVAKEPWLAWLEYSEADSLLDPTSFVTSTNLDKLRAEQHLAAPTELSDGISTDEPLVVKGANGQVFRITSMRNNTAPDGSLQLVLRYAEGAILLTEEANRGRNLSVAEALLLAHPELRQGFSSVIVFADVPGQSPSVLSVPMAAIPA